MTILRRRGDTYHDDADDYHSMVRAMHAAARDRRLWDELRPRLVRSLVDRGRQSPESAANIVDAFARRPSLLPQLPPRVSDK